MSHLTVNSNTIPFYGIIDKVLDNMGYGYPKTLKIKFINNKILLLIDEQIVLEFSIYKLLKYENTVSEITIPLDEVINELRTVWTDMVYMLQTRNRTIEIIIDNYVLYISIDDEITLEIPVTYIKLLDGTVANNDNVNPEHEVTEVTKVINDNNLDIDNQQLNKKDDYQQSNKNDDYICKICMDKEIATINLPCAHLCFCIPCSQTYVNNDGKTCPICMMELVEIKRFFK